MQLSAGRPNAGHRPKAQAGALAAYSRHRPVFKLRLITRSTLDG